VIKINQIIRTGGTGMPSVRIQRVTPEQMRSTAQRVQGQIGNWQACVNKINSFVAQMATMWDGRGSVAFNRVFEEDRPRFQQLTGLMTEYVTAITTAANRYDANEQEVQSAVSRRRN